MNKKIIVINNGFQYLGMARLNKSGDLEVIETNPDDQKYLQALLKQIIKRGVRVFMSKQTGYGDVVYYQPVSKNKPDAYLEGVRDGFRGFGLTVYLLKLNQARLWRLMHQTGLSKEIKNKIFYYMQDIPEDIMTKMIAILEEWQENCQEKLQELLKQVL